MLQLYHWEPNIGSGALVACLKEKRLPFESRYVDLLQWQQHRPEFLRLEPFGELPVLLHEGHVISGLAPTLLYVEDVFAAPRLAPATLPELYEAHFWIKYSEDRMAPYANALGWHRITRPGLAASAIAAARESLEALPLERRRLWEQALDDGYSAEELALAHDALAAAVSKLETALGRAPWLCGERYSLADLALVFIVRGLRAAAPELLDPRQASRTLEWLARVEARPAVREALALARHPAPERLFAIGREPPRWG
ncbi:MAG: glutathione S-transferase family protein [Steroidobacteraceae bacterium]